jgi:hypothetical protein
MLSQLKFLFVFVPKASGSETPKSGKKTDLKTMIEEWRRRMTFDEQALFGIDKLNVVRSDIPVVALLAHLRPPKITR